MILVSSCSCLRSIHWSQVLSWEWRCSWSSADRRSSNYIWVINKFIAYLGATYTRGFTVSIIYYHYESSFETSLKMFEAVVVADKKVNQIMVLKKKRQWIENVVDYDMRSQKLEQPKRRTAAYGLRIFSYLGSKLLDFGDDYKRLKFLMKS